MSFFKKIKNETLPNFFRKRNIGVLIFLSLLITWGLIRSCSHPEHMRKKLYYIGRDSTWYPQQLMGKERNLKAFTNDIMAAIAKETQLHFEWIETGPVALIEGLDNGNYDAIISAIRPNFINRNKYIFSDLFFELGPVLIVKQTSSAKSLKDMQDKTIGIRTGSFLIFNTIKEGGAHAYNFLITSYDNANKALESLDKNQMDGVIMEAIPAYAFTEGFYSDRLKIVTPPLTDEGLRLVALKEQDSQELISDFDKALRKLKDDGTYDKLISKWNLIDPQIQFLKKRQSNP